MNVRFTHISGQNFCGLKSFDFDLYDRSLVSGANTVGKSTLMNAFSFVILNKNADGSESAGIRPHDENGKDIDMVDIVVELTMMADDKQIVIKKTQKQNWVKDRTTQEQTFKGNENTFEVNGIPKKEKDFKEYLGQFFDLDAYAFCTNPKAFTRLDTKKRRAILFDLIGDVTNDDVIATDSRFEELRSDLMDGTVEELVSRSKGSIKRLKEELVTIPARIDELNNQKEEIDVESVTKAKAELIDSKVITEQKLEAIEHRYSEFDEIQEEINATRKELSQYTFDYDKKNREAGEKVFWELQGARKEYADVLNDIQAKEKIRDEYCDSVANMKEQIASVRENLAKEEESTFDENKLVCPVCGSKYTKSKADKMKSDFEDHKSKAMESMAKTVEEIQGTISEYEAKIEVLTDEVIDLESRRAEAKTKMDSLNQEYESACSPSEANTTEEYKAIVNKIVLKEEILASRKDLDEMRLELSSQLKEIESMISELNVRLEAVNRNEQIDSRINELQEQILTVNQNIANQERILDLLQAFNMAKINLLTDKINAHFRIIKWQMFKEQINGGFTEVCIPLVEGTSYDGLLNHGNKILAEIDMCQAFQGANDILCPICVDDAESVDPWRIPDIDSQLIVIRRTDDKELSVTELK